ncbi:MAG: hypothetical protein MZU97_00420 [Bacillus subtilis]|nr:hypothetical protein [Bacillus subtilis]
MVNDPQRKTVSYDVVVPTAGWYQLTFKVLQDTKTNGVVFRTIRDQRRDSVRRSRRDCRLPYLRQVAELHAHPTRRGRLICSISKTGRKRRRSLAVDLIAPYREAYYAAQSTCLTYVNATVPRNPPSDRQPTRRRPRLGQSSTTCRRSSTDLSAMADALGQDAMDLRRFVRTVRHGRRKSESSSANRDPQSTLPRDEAQRDSQEHHAAYDLVVFDCVKRSARSSIAACRRPLDMDQASTSTPTSICPTPNGSFFAGSLACDQVVSSSRSSTTRYRDVSRRRTNSKSGSTARSNTSI